MQTCYFLYKGLCCKTAEKSFCSILWICILAQILAPKQMRLDFFLSGKASTPFLTGCAPSIAFPDDPSQGFYESWHSPALKTHSFSFPVRYGCGRDCNMDGCAWKCVEACVVKVKGLKQRRYSFVPSTGLVPEQIQTLA